MQVLSALEQSHAKIRGGRSSYGSQLRGYKTRRSVLTLFLAEEDWRGCAYAATIRSWSRRSPQTSRLARTNRSYAVSVRGAWGVGGRPPPLSDSQMRPGCRSGSRAWVILGLRAAIPSSEDLRAWCQRHRASRLSRSWSLPCLMWSAWLAGAPHWAPGSGPQASHERRSALGQH